MSEDEGLSNKKSALGQEFEHCKLFTLIFLKPLVCKTLRIGKH